MQCKYHEGDSEDVLATTQGTSNNPIQSIDTKIQLQGYPNSQS